MFLLLCSVIFDFKVEQWSLITAANPRPEWRQSQLTAATLSKEHPAASTSAHPGAAKYQPSACSAEFHAKATAMAAAAW